MAAREQGSRWREDAEARMLVLRVQRGDSKAGGELYERYFDRVHAYVRSVLGHAADTEDVAQQVFANAFGALDRYDVDGASSFRGWLFVIAHNQLCKSVRGRDRARVLAPHELARRIDRERSVADPSERVLGWELGAQLARLPVRQRQVLALRFRCDLTTAEIAQVLDVAEQAVYKAEQRGLATMRRRLAEGEAPRRVLHVSMARRDPGLPVLRARRMALLFG